MRLPLLLAALVPLLAVTGCAASDPEFGRVVQHNIVAHVVDLEPEYAGQPLEGSNGQRAATAITRYRRGAVKQGSAGGGTGGAGGGGAPAAAAAPQ